MAINLSTLFARYGKLFYLLQAINTARGTTIPAEAKDYTDQFASASLALLRTIETIPGAVTAFQQSAGGLVATCQQAAIDLLIQTVKADNPQFDEGQESALREMIRQMEAAPASVDATAVSATPAAAGGNVGDATLVATVKRGDGRVNENMQAETITLECTNDSADFAETFSVRGQVAVRDRLSQDWPAGSGVSSSTTVLDVDAAGNLIVNGSFETEDDEIADAPAGWLVVVGTPGTTIDLTPVEVQTIAISGTPTGGTWQIIFSRGGLDQYTTPLPFDATAADVQAALRALVGLGNVTVEAAGSSPNLTHTVTLTGVSSPISEFTSLSRLTGGTPAIAHDTTTAVSPFALRGGRALRFTSDGSELTEIWQRVTLAPLTSYGFHSLVGVDAAPVAGVVKVDLFDGSATIDDAQGVANELTIDATALTSTPEAASTAEFRTPQTLPDVVYVRIRISTALDNGTEFYVDAVKLAELESLYEGGPAIKLFAGSTPHAAGDGAQNAGDGFTLTVASDRGGKFQEWFDRVFDMRAKNLLLPSKADGSETIDEDALIS